MLIPLTTSTGSRERAYRPMITESGVSPDSVGLHPVHRDLVCPDRLKDRDGSPDCTLLGCRGDNGHIGKRCQGFVGSPEPGGVYSVIIREQDRWLHLSW